MSWRRSGKGRAKLEPPSLRAVAFRDALYPLGVMDGPGFVYPPVGLGLGRPRQKRQDQEERGEPVPHGPRVANSRPRSTLPIQQADSTD